MKTGRGETTNRNRLLALGLFVLGALAVLEINDTPLLPGAHADSVEYMEAARSLAAGKGLTIPMASWASPDTLTHLSHFPPGPSVAMAGLMWVSGVRPHVAALWLMALAAGATLAVVFLLVLSEEGWVVGLISALLVGVLPPFLLVHAAIWSEPLYLPLLLTTLWLMVNRPERPALAGIVAACGVMVRYLGLAAVAAVGVWTFMKTRSLRKTAVGVFPGAGAFLAWWVWTGSRGEAVRSWGEFSVPFSRTLAQIPDMVRFWLAPGLPLFLAVLLLLGIAITHLKGRPALTRPLGLLILSHLGMILVSRLLVDERIPFDARMFLPVIVLAMLPVAGCLWKRRQVGLVVLVVWFGWILREDIRGIGTARESGLYYTASGWLGSDVLPWLADAPEDFPLYSNEPGFIVFHARRSARFLPLRTENLNDFFQAWTENPGAIILLRPQRPDEWTYEVYVETLPLEAAVSSGNALVLVPSNNAGTLLLPGPGGALPEGSGQTPE